MTRLASSSRGSQGSLTGLWSQPDLRLCCLYHTAPYGFHCSPPCCCTNRSFQLNALPHFSAHHPPQGSPTMKRTLRAALFPQYLPTSSTLPHVNTTRSVITATRTARVSRSHRQGRGFWATGFRSGLLRGPQCSRKLTRHIIKAQND